MSMSTSLNLPQMVNIAINYFINSPYIPLYSFNVNHLEVSRHNIIKCPYIPSIFTRTFNSTCFCLCKEYFPQIPWSRKRSIRLYNNPKADYIIKIKSIIVYL